MPTPNALERTTSTISPACHKCGSIAKSGRPSCCGRGGSWFGTCGRAGNANLRHTWFEGIQACKARSQIGVVVGQQESAVQQEDIESSYGSSKVNSKGVITAAKLFAFSLAKAQASMSVTTSTIETVSTSASTSIVYILYIMYNFHRL